MPIDEKLDKALELAFIHEEYQCIVCSCEFLEEENDQWQQFKDPNCVLCNLKEVWKKCRN